MSTPIKDPIEQSMPLRNVEFSQTEYQRLAKGLENIADYAIILLDENGIVTNWSNGASQVLGFTAEEAIGLSVSRFYTAESITLTNLQQNLEDLAKGGRIEDDGWWLHKNGKSLRAHVAISPITDQNQLLGFSLVLHCLIGKTQSEEILRQTEERFSLLVQSVKDYAIFMLSPDGHVVTWNEGAQRINGYSPDEIIGKHFSNFYPQEAIDRKHPQYELRVAIEQGRFEEEGWRLRKNGEMFWANVIITALYDHNKELIGFAKVTRDLTERKLILDQLQKAKEDAEALRDNYRLLIEGVRDYAILMLDPQGIVRSWNSGVERIKGYTAQEIIGKHFSTFYVREDVESGKCEFELQYAELEGVFEDEGLRVRKDGTLFWANVLITALKDEKGELIGFSKITRDITDRKNAEQALRESEKRYRFMADKVIQRSREFHTLNKQLEAINRELESFSYSVSHDLRAPLRNINGFTRLILEDKADQLDEEAKDYMERVCLNTNQMGQLIDDLLKLSRLSRQTLRQEPVNLSDLAQEVIKELQRQEPDRDAEIYVDEGLMVEADMGLMRIALQNLLSNAWKFTSKKEKTVIEFKAVWQDGKSIFYIRDNGVGFDMKYADVLFGAFQRLHDLREFSGTGIGLATVQRILNRHGGKIWVDAKVDQGATFYFTL